MRGKSRHVGATDCMQACAHSRDALESGDFRGEFFGRSKSQRTGQDAHSLGVTFGIEPYEKVKADTERDNYMTAQEALEYGLIDVVVDKRQ